MRKRVLGHTTDTGENYLEEPGIFSPVIRVAIWGKSMTEDLRFPLVTGSSVWFENKGEQFLSWFIRGWVLYGMGTRREEGQRI